MTRATDPRSRLARPREEGFVLFFALVALSAILFLGSISFELSGAHAEAHHRYVERIQALSVAEGGVAEAYQRLTEDGTFRGSFTHVSAGGATAFVQIVDAAPNVEIRSVGEVANAQRGLVSVASVQLSSSAAATLPFTIHSPSKITIQGRTAMWSGEAVTEMDISVSDGGGYVGSFRRASVAPIDIDLASLRRLAETDTEDDLGWTSGSHSGTYHTTGNVEAFVGCDFTGTLMVAGNVLVKAAGENFTFRHGERNEVLLIEGDLIIEEAKTVQIEGIVVVEGNVILKPGVELVAWEGALRCNGEIMVEFADLTFNFLELPVDPVVFSEISGVTLDSSTEAQLEAVQSRPITNEETTAVLEETRDR